jgi:hypothetical protein
MLARPASRTRGAARINGRRQVPTGHPASRVSGPERSVGSPVCTEAKAGLPCWQSRRLSPMNSKGYRPARAARKSRNGSTASNEIAGGTLPCGRTTSGGYGTGSTRAQLALQLFAGGAQRSREFCIFLTRPSLKLAQHPLRWTVGTLSQLESMMCAPGMPAKGR